MLDPQEIDNLRTLLATHRIPASEVERVKREGNYGDLEGKATPALVSA